MKFCQSEVLVYFVSKSKHVARTCGSRSAVFRLAFAGRGRLSFSGDGRASQRHSVAINLPGAVWRGRKRIFGNVRSFFCIFHLTTSRTCDSL